MSKTREKTALPSQRATARKTTEAVRSQKELMVVMRMKKPPSLQELVQHLQARLGGGPVARGLAFFEIGRMLHMPFSTATVDFLDNIRYLVQSTGLFYLAYRWDRDVLEKELAMPLANGTLPTVNYFAALAAWSDIPSAEAKALLKQMRAESLSLREFWRRIKAAVKRKYHVIVANRLAEFQLDDESKVSTQASHHPIRNR